MSQSEIDALTDFFKSPDFDPLLLMGADTHSVDELLSFLSGSVVSEQCRHTLDDPETANHLKSVFDVKAGDEPISSEKAMKMITSILLKTLVSVTQKAKISNIADENERHVPNAQIVPAASGAGNAPADGSGDISRPEENKHDPISGGTLAEPLEERKGCRRSGSATGLAAKPEAFKQERRSDTNLPRTKERQLAVKMLKLGGDRGNVLRPEERKEQEADDDGLEKKAELMNEGNMLAAVMDNDPMAEDREVRKGVQSMAISRTEDAGQNPPLERAVKSNVICEYDKKKILTLNDASSSDSQIVEMHSGFKARTEGDHDLAGPVVDKAAGKLDSSHV